MKGRQAQSAFVFCKLSAVARELDARLALATTCMHAAEGFGGSCVVRLAQIIFSSGCALARLLAIQSSCTSGETAPPIGLSVHKEETPQPLLVYRNHKVRPSLVVHGTRSQRPRDGSHSVDPMEAETVFCCQFLKTVFPGCVSILASDLCPLVFHRVAFVSFLCLLSGEVYCVEECRAFFRDGQIIKSCGLESVASSAPFRNFRCW